MAKKSQLEIKKNTPDVALAAVPLPELLKRFMVAKAEANRWDAERDRLRKFIQEHVDAGKHANILLEKIPGAGRAYANSAGLYAVQFNLIIAPSSGLQAGAPHAVVGQTAQVTLVETGDIVTVGVIQDNGELYTWSESLNLKLTEIPDDGSSDN